MQQKQILTDESQTRALGARLARVLAVGDVVALSGGLGSGKTCLARGLIHALLPEKELVPSPSFTLIQTYATRPPIWHIDLYRLDNAAEINELGLFDAMAEAALVIEWPEKMGAELPAERLAIHLEPVDDFAERRATLTAHGTIWEKRLDGLI